MKQAKLNQYLRIYIVINIFLNRSIGMDMTIPNFLKCYANVRNKMFIKKSQIIFKLERGTALKREL